MHETDISNSFCKEPLAVQHAKYTTDPKTTIGGQCQAIQSGTNWAYTWLESWPQETSAEQADKRSSVLEAMRDLAVLEAMLQSSDNKGIPTSVIIDMNAEESSALNN